MLTVRGWNFLLAVLALLAAALAFDVTSLTLVGLTLLVWFLGAWLGFAVRLRLTTGRLVARRRLQHGRGTVRTLWAGVRFRVQPQLISESSVAVPFVRIDDRLPVLVQRRKGANRTEGRLAVSKPLEIQYEAECAAAGAVRFDGLSVQIADLQGFFYHTI